MKLTKWNGPLLLALAGLALVAPANAAANRFPVLTPESATKAPGDEGVICHTHLRILLAGKVDPNASPADSSQYNTPQTIRATYSLPSTGGSHAIALVDAYDYPNALADFNTFATQYSLPTEPSTSPTATNKVFQVVYATGTKPPSGGNTIASWNIEAALDTQWAHAMAPNAKIYLVEAASPSTQALFSAVKVAASLSGVKEVSMSWGSSEYPGETSANAYLETSGVVYFASGGDESEVESPSSSQYVVAAGGTSIARDESGNFLSESGWSDTGCGKSVVIPRPAFQSKIASIIGSNRATTDLSFVADPNTGVYVYCSTPYYGEYGYYIVGGTSVASPSLAGIVNLAASSAGGSFAASSQLEENRIYGALGNAADYYDITTGTDGGFSCTTGWDYITGVGRPVGLGGK